MSYPSWNEDLTPPKHTGKRQETYLHTPSRREWAIEHTMQKHKIPRDDIALFEVEVDRQNLVRRWRGIWSTPEPIQDPRLLKLHSGTLDEGIYESFRDWQPLGKARSQWTQDRRWAEPLQQLTNITQNAAVINAAAEITWESVMAVAGHEFNPGGLVRAGAEATVALSINQANRRFGARGAIPSTVQDLSILPINTATSDSAAFLHNIFTDSASGHYNQSSLHNALSQFDDTQLSTILGEQSALKLRNIADVSKRFGQKSFQSDRDWGSTVVGLFTGDIPNKRQYIYDPDAQAVNIDTGTPWTLDRLLEKTPLTQKWHKRRQFLRENPEQDRLRHLFRPIQPTNAQPSLWYGVLPEARGLSKFFGRYRADKDIGTGNWLDRDVSEIPSQILSAVGAKKTAERMQHRIRTQQHAVEERVDALRKRKENPLLYQWQDPEHFYQQTAEALDISTIDTQLRPKPLGSPYHKWSRHLYNIPQPLQYPALERVYRLRMHGYYVSRCAMSLPRTIEEEEPDISELTRILILSKRLLDKPTALLRTLYEITGAGGTDD